MNYQNMLRITNSLKQRILPRLQGFPANVNIHKKALIDTAFQTLLPQPTASFIDLGGVWGVNGAYTFYTLDRYTISQGYLVDTHLNDTVKGKQDQYPHLRLISGNFGSSDVVKQLQPVDAIFLFDILLHQVSPDWDEILEMYAPLTTCFVIYNQQFMASETTVRLLDLGKEQYFENVPFGQDTPLYRDLFENMHAMNTEHQRIWKDIHNVWQWGITDHDLRTKMTSLGFTERYYKNCGQFGKLANFQNHAFIFTQ